MNPSSGTLSGEFLSAFFASEARARLDLANVLDAIGRDGTAEREHARAMLEERDIVAFHKASSAAIFPD